MEQLRLADVVAPLAFAADGGAGLPPGTALRTTLIGTHLGRRCGASAHDAEAIFYGGILRHLGCTATALEETRLMGDERELRTSFATVDAGSPVAMLKEAVRGFARERGVWARATTVMGFMAAAPKAVPRIFASRCEVAAALGGRLGLGAPTMRALEESYERFDGKGAPHGLRGDALGLPSRVLAIAELVATLIAIPTGREIAIDTVRARAGGQLDPVLARRFLDDPRPLIAAALGDEPERRLLEAEPAPVRLCGVERLLEVAQVVADFADIKSPFLLGHSRAVARLARATASDLGVDGPELADAHMLGLLHDVGRVGISNAIWDHPGPLTDAQWAKVREHARLTATILDASSQWRPLAALAAAAHERVDGRGYPHAKGGGGQPLLCRVLAACDVYQALLEDRAHRPARDTNAAGRELRRMVEDGHLDATVVTAVLDVAGVASPRAAWPKGLTEREVEVVRLLASGLGDKQIAEKLGVSHRTVHHHNQHVYAKIGVKSRAAAALFAIEHGLV